MINTIKIKFNKTGKDRSPNNKRAEKEVAASARVANIQLFIICVVFLFIF